MHIKKIVSQYRRAFTAIYECGHCGHTIECAGYDAAHFHNNVIPEMACGNCGQKAEADYRPLATKYPDDFII